MVSAEVSFKEQTVGKISKEITHEEAVALITELGLKFNLDVLDLVKKVASKQADGFSINKNNPYVHLYVGNGSENVSIELMTLEKETKIKFPKSFFLG